MTSSELQSVLDTIDADKQARALRMPTEKDAIRVMFDAWQRLKELGWRDGQHMPTTADRFAGIQCGSTGIHAYAGTRDDGPFEPPMYTIYDGDLWCTRVPPVLFRPWREDDVQPNLRICAPTPYDAAQPLNTNEASGSPSRKVARPDGQEDSAPASQGQAT